MLEFRDITIADKSWVEPLFRMGNNRSEEFNFTFCHLWQDVFKYRAARVNDYVIIGSFKEGRPPSYLFPSGSGDIAPALKAVEEYSAAKGDHLMFHCVLAPHRALLEAMYPGCYEFLELTDYYDYVYNAESLISLAGKKLHQKRNHINRFKENNPGWSYEPITPENMPDIILMNDKWCELNGCDDDKSLSDEVCAVKNAIRDFFSLGLDGGAIRVDGEIIAYTMGERLNADTYLVHIEKAFGEIQGAYTIINQQFAERHCAGFAYINREDDSGNLGLRKSKQSYRPAFMVEKFAAKKIK